MSVKIYPRWVMDVLADIIQYEEEHGSLMPCFEGTLNRIPAEVRTAAEVIYQYRGTENDLSAIATEHTA